MLKLLLIACGLFYGYTLVTFRVFTYEEARDRFLASSKDADFRISSRHVSENLYTDIAIYNGLPTQTIIHISGTHGVEGYLGSDIQTHFLKEYKHDLNGPTLIFVHALNPWGMKYYQRTNSNNVDLNRNAIFNEWPDRDPNVAGYEDLYDLINNSKLHKFFTTSFSKVKKAMITGTYTHPEGLFYGGSKLEEEHSKLIKILKFYCKQTKTLALIDVHTGLGPYGKDTLLVSPSTTLNVPFKQWVSAHDFDGYEIVLGQVADSYPSQLVSPGTEVLSMVQEFGTWPSFWVGYNLMLENRRKIKTVKLLDIFYPFYTEYNTINKGVVRLHEVIQFIID